MKNKKMKIINLAMLFLLVLTLNVFALDLGLREYPIETKLVGNNDNLGFIGYDSNATPHTYNVKVSYDGKVDYNPNFDEDTIYQHHMYAIGYIGNGNPEMELLQLVVYENGTEVGRTISFSYCQRDHIWPGNQRLYFDETGSTTFTVEHGSGRLLVSVSMEEWGISFIPPTKSLNVYF